MWSHARYTKLVSIVKSSIIVSEMTNHRTDNIQEIRGKNDWRDVFKRFLKKDIDDADVTFSGRVFHSRAAATGKARSITDGWKTGASKQSGDADEPRQ